MNRYQYSHHTFDMNEYLSGERFVVGGLNCDWEDEEEKPVVKVVPRIEVDDDEKTVTPQSKK